MRGVMRRAAVAAGTAVVLVGSAGVLSAAAASPAAAVTCTDNWVGPTSGTTNWNTSADWSAGVPNGNTVACIKKAGTYTVEVSSDGGGAAAAVVVGGAASGTQTFKIDGVNFPITQPSNVLKGGVLSLAPTSSGDADISATGTTVSLTIAAGGTLSSAGTSQAAQIGTPLLVNKGTVTLAAASNNDNAATTDEGSFTVSKGSTFTSSGTYFTHSAGKLTVHGTFNGENTFTQSGGTETGNPVVQHAGTLVDSAGTGSFIAYQATIEGTIPVGQTVTNRASPGNSNDTIGTPSAGVTVHGTLSCKTASGTICSFSTSNNTWPGIIVTSGGTLSTAGPGIPSDVYINLSTNIDVKAGGKLTVANPATTFNGSDVTLTNSGTVQVTATGYLDVGDNNVVNSGSTGTIGVTVGSKVTGTHGTIYDSSGFGFTATGTLAVHTVGTEAGRVVITDPAGLSTAFSKLSSGSDHYSVTYVKNTSGVITEVEVTPTAASTASPAAF